MAASPLLKIVNRSVDALVGYERNARTHTAKQIKQIADSITQFGWTNPLLIDDEGNVVAGHGRLEAAKLLRMTSVPCIVLRPMSEAQRRALIIADNKIASNAGWDEDMLRSELEELRGLGVVDMTGFDADEIKRMLGDFADDAAADDQEPLRDQFQIIITVELDLEQRRLFDRLTGEGLNAKLLVS